MLKKRLIFTLLIQNGIFQLSRNFSLQSVGDLSWLYQYYKFDSIAYSIDELVLLNVERRNKRVDNFIPNVIALSKRCFMPITAGGGIQNIDDAYQILDAGADKLVLNTALFTQPKLIENLVQTFGSQCIVASIDYKRVEQLTEVYIDNGMKPTGLTIFDAVTAVENLGVGEIYLTSMDRDGTGQGYELDILSAVVDLCHVPVIASGGVGDFEHFVAGMNIKNVTGVSTANIFNFIGNGLTEARIFIKERGIEVAAWSSILPANI
jgi:imidazole glycerol-phosphate synthase subunit HisF